LSLKQQAFQSGFWLVLKESTNFLVRIIGVLILTKFLTVEQFGLFSILISISFFMGNFSMLGVHIYINRYNKPDLFNICSAANTLVFISSLCCLLFTICLIPVFKLITHITEIFPLIFPLIILQFINNIRLVPMALLERDLKYKSLSQIDMISQFIYYTLAIPLAIFKFGVWAPIIGTFMMTTYTTIGTIYVSKYKFRFSKDIARINDIFRFGVNYTLSSMGWQVRTLILPLIVTPLSSVALVGYISLANRISESLDILRNANSKLSLSVLSKFQDNADKLKSAIIMGTSYQIISLGILSVTFLFIAPYFIKLLLGVKWFPILVILPFIFFNALCTSFGTVQASVLYLKNKSRLIALSYFTQHLVLSVSTYLLMLKFGDIGYCYALIISSPAYLIIAYFTSKSINRINYTIPFLWLASFSITLFFRQIYISVIFFALLPLLFNGPRIQIRYLYSSLKQFFKFKEL
jgi:O-antigen/teichoic acid export membrane protein